MTYGQQPNQHGDVPPPPQPYGAPAPSTYGAQPGYGAPSSPYQQGAPGQPGYGGWHPPAVRPGSVTGGSVLAIIGGIAAILIGLLFFMVSGLAEDPSVLAGTGFSASTFMALGGVVVTVGVLVLIFGIAALKGKYWAAIGLTVIGGIYVALSIWSITQGQTGVILGVGWVVISVALLMSTSSRAWFRSQG